MSKKILEDWEDYDNKKKKVEDRNFVSCQEQWERDYIRDKIRMHYPFINIKDIEAAIEKACQNIHGNKPRVKFMEYVCKELGISLL